MLNEKLFDKGLEEIEIAFTNFFMTKERAKVWYKYSKDLEDSKWQKKIKNCIKGCRKIPTLADILDIKGYFSNDNPGYMNPPDLPVDDYDYFKSKCPDAVRERIIKANKKSF